jgi:monooxygenase
VTTEHLDVLIVGAGLSGIGAGAPPPDRCPWARYAIFEARGAIGGTWDLFRYPGIRSDSDMYTLGYSFRPWSGEKSIADGASILQYLKDTAAEGHRPPRSASTTGWCAADWSSDDACWHVTAERTDPEAPDRRARRRVELTCGFLFSCSGVLPLRPRPPVPDFPGMADFQWPDRPPPVLAEDLDHAGQAGGGHRQRCHRRHPRPLDGPHGRPRHDAPALADLPGVDAHQEPDGPPSCSKVLPAKAAGTVLKWMNALGTQGLYRLSKRRPDSSEEACCARASSASSRPATTSTPTSRPATTPGTSASALVADGDLFKEIRDGKVDRGHRPHRAFTETGIRLESGASSRPTSS